MKNDYTYEMALTMLPGIGSTSARQLLDITGSAESVFKASPAELHSLFGHHSEIIDAINSGSPFKAVEQEMEFILKNNIKIHYYTDPDYPQRLNKPGCTDSPILLYSLGNADLNPERAVSIVGTRKATPQGVELTRSLVAQLRGEGITVVSGLAYGIDAAAHTASVDNGVTTIGVVAHGLDMIYPQRNRQLAKRMVHQDGAIITEMRSGTPISAGIFPARNRIIAAMSDATIVVEASKVGGALITANLASGYNRDLFAFPGRIGDKYSEGCNAIIANCKAMLIRNADDLFHDMGWDRKSRKQGRQTTIFPNLTPDEQSLYNIMKDHAEISVDELHQLSNLPLPIITSTLLSLELKGCCMCFPGMMYKAL